MTKNTSLLCFSFVIKGLLAPDHACNSVYSQCRMAWAIRLTTPFSNARPDTGKPYRAARARTIPDTTLEVKYLAKNLASFLPYRFFALSIKGTLPLDLRVTSLFNPDVIPAKAGIY
jgi:hypothetical protein